MKQKIVIKVEINCGNRISKAFKVAAGIPGIESLAVSGKEMNYVEVVGEGVDAVMLMKLLKKHKVFAELVSVSEVKKQEADKPAPPPSEPGLTQLVPWLYAPSLRHDDYWCYDQTRDPSCNIL